MSPHTLPRIANGCANCTAPFEKDGEPFETRRGLLCRACIRATGEACLCGACKAWRREMGG